MSADAFIFDDEPFFLGYLQVVLSDLGLRVQSFLDAHGALERIRAQAPRVVFLDTLVPGAEGLSLCKEIKADPALAKTKIVIISGKPYLDDKARATWAKADLYVQKPFDAASLYAEIQALLPEAKRPYIRPLELDVLFPPASQGQTPPRPREASEDEKREEARRRPWTLRFWGRGPDASCVSLQDRGRLFVFDAGAGLEAASLQPASGLSEVWLLLTHFHRDHLTGLSHAQRWLEAGLSLHVVGPAESESLLEKLARRALPDPRVLIHPAWAGRFQDFDGAELSALYTMHPGPSFAYRLATRARRVVFAADSEIPTADLRDGADDLECLSIFADGADVLIHDARYADEDYPAFSGRGHSCPRAAFDVAERAQARSLVLYHMDARYDMERRELMAARVRALDAPELKLSSCVAARHGLEIAL